MSRQIAISLLIFILFSCVGSSNKSNKEEEGQKVSTKEEQMEVFLLYPNYGDGLFYPYPFKVNKEEQRELALKAILDALINEIPNEPLFNPFQEGSEVRAVYCIDEKSVIVDLNLKSASDGGSENEIFRVYSIVNTLNRNFREIERVKILVDGMERETFMGHIDIASFIPPEPKLNGENVQ